MTDRSRAANYRRVAIILALAAVGASIAAPRAADTPTTDWPSYNRTLTSERYVAVRSDQQDAMSRG